MNKKDYDTIAKFFSDYILFNDVFDFEPEEILDYLINEVNDDVNITFTVSDKNCNNSYYMINLNISSILTLDLDDKELIEEIKKYIVTAIVSDKVIN